MFKEDVAMVDEVEQEGVETDDVDDEQNVVEIDDVEQETEFVVVGMNVKTVWSPGNN